MLRKKHRIKIKEHARSGLAGCWMKGAVLTLVSALLSMFCLRFLPLYAPAVQLTPELAASATPLDLYKMFADMLVPDVITPNYLGRIGVFFLLSLLIVPPFCQGMKEFFYRAYLGEKPRARVAFAWYADLGRVFGAVRLYIAIALRAFFWGAVIFAVPIGGVIAAPILGGWASALAALLALPAWLLFMVRMEAYTPAYYIFALTPQSGVRAAVRSSVAITRGLRWRCFVFRLSFLPWMILAGVTGTVGQMFFEPYLGVCHAGMTDVLIARAASSVKPDAPQE